MKKYNVENYIRYKNDLKKSMPEGKMWDEYSRNELIVKFLPLVENLARKFATSQQASGVLTIEDLVQIGSEGLIVSIDKLDWERLNESEDIEKTLKSFLSKRIKGAIRRRIDINRSNIKIPEHKRNEIRNNPDNKDLVSIFFNSIFLSTDSLALTNKNGQSMYDNLMDDGEPYNIDIFNYYLKTVMKKHLSNIEYEVLRLSYGLDCEKHSAKEIEIIVNIKGVNRISEIKRSAVQKLIKNVDYNQFIEIL